MSIRRSLTALVLPLLLLVWLTACSPASGGSRPPGKSPANGAQRVLRFEVGPGRTITAPVAMKARMGTDIKLKLNNRSGRTYSLTLVGPAGEKRAGITVAGHHLGQTNFVFTKKGTYTVAVRRTGRSQGKSFPIAVRAG